MHSSLSLKCPLKYIFNTSLLKYFFPFWGVLNWILECYFSGLNVGKSQLLRQKVNLGGDNERVGTPLKSGRCLIALYHYKGSRGWAAEMGPWAEWIFKAHVQWHSSSDKDSSPHFQTAQYIRNPSSDTGSYGGHFTLKTQQIWVGYSFCQCGPHCDRIKKR